MNLFAFLRIGPDGRIDLPMEFREQLGLPNGPAYIEARLCVDGIVELGPVVPGEVPSRKSGQLPGLVVPDTFDEQLSADETKAWDLDKPTAKSWEGYRKFVADHFPRVEEHGVDTDDEQGDAPGLGYEIREQRLDNLGRTQIEAWLPGRHSPLVRAVPRGYTWLVLAGREIADLAGLDEDRLTGIEAISHTEALTWVRFLAALYVKAAAK